jgi:hypothetical protein
MDLTDTMKDALRALASSPGGVLRRLSGGYWTTAEIEKESPLHAVFPHPPRWYASTSTVRALEARGLAEGISWHGPRHLTEAGRLAAADVLLEHAKIEKRDLLLAHAGRITREHGHAMSMYEALDNTGTRLKSSCEKCGEEVTVLVHEGHAWGPPMFAACADPREDLCIHCREPVTEAAELKVLAEGIAHERCHRAATACPVHGVACSDGELLKNRR